jgi:hypothetical protein
MLGESSGWACGYRFNAAAFTYDGLIYRYDGTNWKVALFLPGAVGARLMAIDFLSDTDGWALGNRESEGGGISGPVVLHYDGEAWAEVPTEGLNGAHLELLAAVGENDVWATDGLSAFHYDGMMWVPYPLSVGGPVNYWVFPDANVGWAVNYDSGYCYKWDREFGMWLLESQPLYNATAFYFNADGSGVYADHEDIPPVTERANIYEREAGPEPSYEMIYATSQSRILTACDFFPPDYYFFAGPNSAFEVDAGEVRPLGYVPLGDLGIVRRISITKPGEVWGIMGTSLTEGPSFIVHKTD